MANEVVVIFRGQDAGVSQLAKKLAGDLQGLSGQSERAGRSAGRSSGLFSKMGSALGGVATVAGGIVAAQLFNKMASGVAGFVREGLQAVGAYQGLEVRLNSLFSSNLAYTKSVEQTTVAHQKSAEEVAKDQQKLATLRTERDLQISKINEQKERVRQMTDVWTDEGLATDTARAKLAKMENQLGNTEREIASLESSTVSFSTTTESKWIPSTLSAVEIQRMAQDETDNLIKGIEDLAKISPFPTERIQEAGAFAVQMGLNSDRALDLTRAMTNFGSAMALPADELIFMMSNLKQMHATQRLNVIDMREMSRRGLDVAKVLEVEMGMSVDEFNEKVKDSPELMDQFIDSIIDFTDTNFSGSVEAMSKTLPGMLGNLKDIIMFASRDFFLPIVDAVQPIAQNILEAFDKFLVGNMANIGQGIVDTLKGVFSVVSGDDLGIVDLIEGLSGLGIDRDTIVQIANFADTVQEAIKRIKEAFEGEGLSGVINEVGATISSAWTTTIQPALQQWGDDFWTWIAETVLPNASIAIGAVSKTIFSLIEQYWPMIATGLRQWRDNFFGWVAELYPQIPTVLGAVVTNLATWLSENWPAINETLTEWGNKFWEWVNVAMEGAATALAGIAIAIGAWIMGEGSGQLIEFGNQLGQMLVDGLTMLFSDPRPAGDVIVKLLGGLAVAVGVSLALLVAIGGSIVAGIVQGILEKLGVEIETATLGELPGILTGIGDNALTIAAYIGEQIIAGIQNGMAAIFDLRETIIEGVTDVWEGVKEFLGISSPSTLFAEIGLNIVQGLIQGISDNIGALASIAGELLGSLFGGGEDEEGGMSFDFSGVIESLVTAIPEALATLQETFSLFFQFLTEQLNTLIAGPLFMLSFKLVEIYTIHLPTMQTVAETAMAAIVTAINPVGIALQGIINLILRIMNLVDQMASAFQTAMESISETLEDALENLGDLEEAVDSVAQAFQDMAEAAQGASRASKEVGGEVEARTGVGFQTGTGPLGFMVPPGFPNDSFPIRVTSGERVLVAPRGRSIEEVVGQRGGGGTVNNWSVNINTGEAPGSAAQSLQTLMGLANSGI